MENNQEEQHNQSQYMSLFDDIEIHELRKFQLWDKQSLTSFKKSDVLILEGHLYKKCKQQGCWKQKFYRLYPNKLIAYEEKNGNLKPTSSMQLLSVRIEKIRFQEKDGERYGVRFTKNQHFCELYMRTRDLMLQWFEDFKKYCVLCSFSNDYSAISILGKGNFAKVYYSRSKQTGKEFAVKAFQKDKFENFTVDRPALIKEIGILRKLNHKNVIKMYEVYENSQYVFLVKELLKGGELFHKIKGSGSYSEELAAKIIHQLLQALKYIHSKNIMHRDLKPENLILRHKDDSYDVVIADFGLADFYNKEGDYMFKRCGTPGYVAPEVLQDQAYDFKVDVFSIGVIMYILLSGVSPFKGNSYDEIVLKNYNCTINFKYNDMHKKLSAEAYDLLKSMLKKEPEDRFTADEALQHPWFKMKLQQDDNNTDDEIPSKTNTNNKGKVLAPIKLQQDCTNENLEKRKSDLLTKTPLMRKEFNTPQDYQSPTTWKKNYQKNKQNFRQEADNYCNEDSPKNDEYYPDSPKRDYALPYQRTPNSKESQSSQLQMRPDNFVNEPDLDIDFDEAPNDEQMVQLKYYDFSAKLRIGRRQSISQSNSPLLQFNSALQEQTCYSPDIREQKKHSEPGKMPIQQVQLEGGNNSSSNNNSKNGSTSNLNNSSNKKQEQIKNLLKKLE